MASPSPRGLSLNGEHVAAAVLASEDRGETLDLSHKNFADVGDEGMRALGRVGAVDDEDEGTVKRIALGYNYLQTLPAAFEVMTRLRYLNLRGNNITVFPEVLTGMRSLEILDISRNKIKRLPPQPGNLIHLRILCLSKNRLHRLPRYIAYFSNLKILKIDHNPIEWPPKEVVDKLQGEGDMVEWIAEVKMWIEEHGPEDVERVPLTGDRRGEDVSGFRSAMLERVGSEASLDSHGFLASPAPPHTRNVSDDSTLSFISATPLVGRSTPLRPPPLRLPTFSSSSPSSPLRSPDFSAVSGEDQTPLEALPSPTIHGRGASYSVGRRTRPQMLGAKKSLPDLRSTNYPPTPSRSRADTSVPPSMRPASKGRSAERPPGLPPLQLLSPSSILPREASSLSQPSSQESSSPIPGKPPPMDAERNSYFRRLSTLPPSTISRTVPDALLKVMDAVRGILFAVSQVYSSLRHYTVHAIDDRLASLLNRVLEPASTYMGQLINSLDHFDSFSRRGMPTSAVCREVLKSCQDNLAVFGKVVSVLQAQLKVLAGTDDVRYTRTLLLMLYGSMAEVSNSWQAMGPHLAEIKPLLRDARIPVTSKGRPSLSGGTPVTPIAEQQEFPSPNTTPQADRSNASSSQPPAPVSIRRARRHAGSFSVKDVEVGRHLPSALSPVPGMPDTPGLSSGVPEVPPLPSALRNPIQYASTLPAAVGSPAFSSISSPYSAQSSSSHIRNDSQTLPPSHYITPPATASRPSRPILTPSSSSSSFPSHLSPTPTAGPRSPAPLPPDSSQVFDGDLLTMMETAADTAASVWSMLMELLDRQPEPKTDLRTALTKAEQATESLRSELSSSKDGSTAPQRKALWERANHFVKTVVQVSTLVKMFSAENPLPPNLRTSLGRLTQVTKDFAVFLHVSSLAPPARSQAQRAFSPAPDESPRLGVGGIPQNFSSRSASPSASLLRARSDTATPTKGAQLSKDMPWSAQPHQTFRILPVPRQVESATRPTFDSHS